MRFIHVVWCLDERAGGLPKAVVLIANAQARSGANVMVLTTQGRGEHVDGASLGLVQTVGVHVFERSRLTGRFAGSPELRRWLHANLSKDDVVHAHAIWDLASAAATSAARRRGARLVVSPHGSLEPFDLQKHALLKRMLGPVAIRPALDAAVVHCTTVREADSLVTYGALPVVEVIPLPCERVETSRDGAGFRTRHHISADVPLLLFVGRVNYKKGLTHLVKALARMRRTVHLVVAGSGESATNPR